MTTVTTTVVFIIIIFTILSITLSAATQPPSSSPSNCTEELVMFSPCLPYVSASPNNLTDTPNPICCSVYSSSAGKCLCYLLRQPMILGFPLDRSRLISLSELCTDRSSDQSFESFCSVSETPELPPFQSIQFTYPLLPGKLIENVSVYSAMILIYIGNAASTSPPSIGLAPESVGDSPSYSPEAATESPQSEFVASGSPIRRNVWFAPTAVMTLAIIILTRRPPPPPPPSLPSTVHLK